MKILTTKHGQFTNHMINPMLVNKINNCNNFNDLSIREACLQRQKVIIKLFPESGSEEWKPIFLNENFLVSNHGKVKHLFSYGGKPRILYPTIRNNKYPYVTITVSGKRKGIALRKLVMDAFPETKPLNYSLQ